MDRDLSIHAVSDVPWRFVPDGAGRFGLGGESVIEHVADAIRGVSTPARHPDAVVLTSMMHTTIIVGSDGRPRSPVRTWRDRWLPEGTADRIPDPAAYRERTGCYVHPSFPATRLLALRRGGGEGLEAGFRIESVKAFVHRWLTGESVEDVSTASASGFLNLATGDWDRTTLEALELDESGLPPIVGTEVVSGTVRTAIAGEIGIGAGTPVVAGLGDGFAATRGSGCNPGGGWAVTLGTTSSVRKLTGTPRTAMDGTFCYRFREGQFLVGMASSNGGNVLDWTRETFPDAAGLETPLTGSPEGAVPLFLPFLEGERAPFWNVALQPRWRDVDTTRSTAALRTAAVEGTVFLVRYAFDRLRTDHESVAGAVISGNGFRERALGTMLAALLDVPLLEPEEPGLATIRGAACAAFGALGEDTTAALAAVVAAAGVVTPSSDPGVEERFERFRQYLDGILTG